MSERKITVSVASLQPAQFTGWGTKQGGSWKSWKRRFFVLKDRKLWYFESENSTTAKGWIDLPPGTDVKDESERPKKLAFSINSRGVKGIRTFHLTVDTENDFVAFLNGLNKVLGNVKQKTKIDNSIIDETSKIKFTKSFTEGTGIENITKLKNRIKWLNSGQVASLLECALTALPEDTKSVDFCAVVSSDCNSIDFRFAGEQVPMLQSVVDTFWAVGTPPSEIERLNNIGIKVDPRNLGLWLNISERGGMDGGWFMLTEHSPNVIKLVSDGGKINDKIMMLLGINGINKIDMIGRDLGVTPPRQTEYRFKISGHERSNIVKDFFEKCKIKGYNLLIQKIVNDAPSREVLFSVKTTNFDLVKLTIIIEFPTSEIVQDAVELVKGFNVEKHNDLIVMFGNPIALEISCLQQGFGYEVFDEGLGVALVYNLQDENITTVPFKKSLVSTSSRHCNKQQSSSENSPQLSSSVTKEQTSDNNLPQEGHETISQDVSSHTTTYGQQETTHTLPAVPPLSPKRKKQVVGLTQGSGSAPPPVPPLSPRRQAEQKLSLASRPTGAAPSLPGRPLGAPPRKPAAKPKHKQQINPAQSSLVI
ncbi:hypothetical protein EHI8A_032220 [Entamoeba histolytica HM-1:IMSS-B]|uniref:PH domain-containing protein n=5 Tax=Entamoeba histolytica TaxID=5759 RepID=B1N2U3_ENTH1|nr:uncharacterized protein EHI_127250 [Entamoeba histolytica HM-1:IMSS]EMD46518.1 PH domain containing protein [Entamoeba histolytica KU27]EMH77412.1 hypothetical protein EHI8A_032220 [Entamoeba histolytica HM-1:IMSS-B]ENY65578.1 PH domain containing protein [Entamoeba histolytica HM-1:IMSS-A]GAT93247.1 hypothetical protein conserved domain containing [Entamoeba histolytica]EDS89718.1 hypothetical protein, conserved domain containing [Entamoeba histolytica HM-1:IMSS]|eukprot:XP_001913509.1 uncharacterized protein EHI_127250 [Entamoeba histolytica HM-1:IMSS]